MTIETAKKLVTCCIQAPTADNHQPLKYRYADGFIHCSYDDDRVRGRTFSKDDPATLLAVGAAYENLLQAAQALGVSIGSNQAPDTSDEFFSVKIENSDTPKDIDLSSHPIFLRHTNRNAFSPANNLADVLKQLAFETYREVKPIAITDKADIDNIATLVQQASLIRFETQEVHEWLGKSIRYGKNKEDKLDGLDINSLGLPPGGGLFMKLVQDWSRMQFLNRLGMSSIMAKIDAQPVARAQALIAITGEDSTQGAIKAGGVLTKVWSEINRLGLAVQPYYVLSDLEQRLKTDGVPPQHRESARNICDRAKSVLEIEANQRLYMIFRIGKAKKEAVRSLRLPIESVFEDSSQ